MRSNVLNKKRNDDKYCFIRSILVSLHPCDNDHSKRVSNYKQQFDELNIQGFDFSNGFKSGYVHKFEKLNNLSIKIFEINFNQDKGKRKHNLIPTEIIKNDSDKVIDLKINRNLYVPNKKINVPYEDHHKNFIYRQCLYSYTIENGFLDQKQNCGDDNTCTIRTSSESHLYWKKKHFHKNPLNFRSNADFEADNEVDGSSLGNKTTNIYKQNPVLNGYYMICEKENVLESGYYESPLG